MDHHHNHESPGEFYIAAKLESLALRLDHALQEINRMNAEIAALTVQVQANVAAEAAAIALISQLAANALSDTDRASLVQSASDLKASADALAAAIASIG